MKKLVVLGITGSIAAVRAFDLCRLLRRKGFDVQVVMSPAACGIITRDTMQWASDKEVILRISGKVEHVKLFGKKGKASLLLIAPATANTISKIAMGIDDTAITTMATTAIGSKVPVLIAPAMHEPMYEHPIVKKNLAFLENEKRIRMVSPLVEEEKAKMAPIEQILLEVERALGGMKFEGKNVLVANGATYSRIDPMRVLTNLSSGKTGRETAKEFYIKGAFVKTIECGEYSEFSRAVLQELEKGCDYFVCPAAISDFKVKESKSKIPSGKGVSLKLEPTEKLIAKVRKKFPKLKIIAFKAEAGKTKKQIEKTAKDFLKKNRFEMVVANDIAKNPAGRDSSEMLLLTKAKSKWVKGSKEKIAGKIVSFAKSI